MVLRSQQVIPNDFLALVSLQPVTDSYMLVYCSFQDRMDHLHFTRSPSLQLMDAVYHPSKPSLADVVHHSQGLTEKLKSSLRSLLFICTPRAGSMVMHTAYMLLLLKCSVSFSFP